MFPSVINGHGRLQEFWLACSISPSDCTSMMLPFRLPSFCFSTLSPTTKSVIHISCMRAPIRQTEVARKFMILEKWGKKWLKWLLEGTWRVTAHETKSNSHNCCYLYVSPFSLLISSLSLYCSNLKMANSVPKKQLLPFLPFQVGASKSPSAVTVSLSGSTADKEHAQSPRKNQCFKHNLSSTSNARNL